MTGMQRAREVFGVAGAEINAAAALLGRELPDQLDKHRPGKPVRKTDANRVVLRRSPQRENLVVQRQNAPGVGRDRFAELVEPKPRPGLLEEITADKLLQPL